MISNITGNILSSRKNRVLLYYIMLYIRHGEKAYRNGESDKFYFDPPLTEHGKSTAIIRFSDLLFKQGLPQYIVSSPYLRARETAQIAHDVILQLTGVTVPINYDPLLGEYLGNQRKKDLADGVRPETLELDPIPPEEWRDYSLRIQRHISQASNYTWYITHGVVIQSIAYLKAGKKLAQPAELTGILVTDNTITMI